MTDFVAHTGHGHPSKFSNDRVHHISLHQDNELNITPEKSVMKKKTESTAPQLTLSLAATPEKKLNKKLFKNNLTNLQEVSQDPELNITPEKPSILSKGNKQAGKEPKSRNRVRFNVSSDVSEKENLIENNEENLNDIQQVQYPATAIPTRNNSAAIYTQRNPLINLSENHCLLSDTTISSSGDSTIWYSNDSEKSNLTCDSFIEPNVCEIKDMNGKVIGDKLPKGNIKNKPRSNESNKAKSKIMDVVQDCYNISNPKIDKITRHNNTQPLKVQKPKLMLKKKQGLQRHQHTVQYSSNDICNENALSKPIYNSSLAVGQELQALRLQEFNPDEIIAEKLAEDTELKMYVNEKTALATNIGFQEQLYSNLVSVEVSNNWKDQCSHLPTFRKLKPINKPLIKTKPHKEPGIFDNFSPNFFQEDVILDLKSIKVLESHLMQTDIDNAMDLDKLSNIWTNM